MLLKENCTLLIDFPYESNILSDHIDNTRYQDTFKFKVLQLVCHILMDMCQFYIFFLCSASSLPISLTVSKPPQVYSDSWSSVAENPHMMIHKVMVEVLKASMLLRTFVFIRVDSIFDSPNVPNH